LLALLDVAAGGLQQLQDDVLDVFADVPRLGERRGVHDREGDREQLGQRLREQASCRFPSDRISRMFDFVSSMSFRLRGCFWISIRL